MTIASENDSYGAGTDKNYTNGALLSVLKEGQDVPAILEPIMRKLPNYSSDEKKVVSFTVGQNMYTPEDIARQLPDSMDRPYAGMLYASMGATFVEKEKVVHDYELLAGIVGPASLAEPTQKFVHRIKGSQRPNGWSRQLHNEPVFMASYRKRLPGWKQLKLPVGKLSFMPHGGGSLGNVMTHASAGGILSYSPQDAPLVDIPALVRPSLPGTGYFESSGHFTWQLFTGAEGRYVIRNLFLDGNSFHHGGARVEKKNFVFDGVAGISAVYKNWKLGYTTVYRSKEFYGQKGASLFGSLTLSRRF